MSMDSMAFSFVSALSGPERPDGDDRKIYVIVPTAQAYLADLLGKMFEGRGDVEIVVDRRRGERRAQNKVVDIDRRRSYRRRHHEEMVQVVIGKVSRSGGPP